MPLPDLTNSGVSQATVEELMKLYQTVAARVSRIIGSANSSAAAVARARMLSDQIDATIHELKVHSAKWTGDAIASAMAGGIARADQQAAAVGLDIDPVSIKGSFALIDGSAMVFARDSAGDLYKAANNMGSRAKSVLRQTGQLKLAEADINRILAGGVIHGAPTETIKELREALRGVHGQTVPIPCKDGTTREYEVGYYAQMVARTKTRQANTQSRHDRLETLGIDLVSIIGRVSKNFCSAYLGQVFSLSGKSDKYPALSELPGHEGPPFHPNCTKSTRPFIEALASESEMSHADGFDDGMLGLTPSQAAYRFRTENLARTVREKYRPWMTTGISGAK